MHPAIRTQVDGEQLLYSLEYSTDFTESDDRTRQEFQQEADVNYILSRYGVAGVGRAPEFGTVDFGLDLQQAMDAIGAAKRMFNKLPDSLREKYPSWQSVLNGLNDGNLRLDLSTEETEPVKTGETKPPA